MGAIAMAMQRGVLDWRIMRAKLEELTWGDGLSREEMLNQSAELRRAPYVRLLRMLPADFSFPDAGSVFSYYEQAEREGRIELADLPPPSGYGTRSPTGLTVPVHRYPPSVGGGYGSGSTGSSAQTGIGREGTVDKEPLT
jgi:hypothetical protein